MRFVGGLFKCGLVPAGDDGERVNLLIFTVTAVVVGIEVADVSAFHNRAHSFFRWNAGWRDEGKGADSAGLEGAHGDSGNAAQIVTGEFLRASAADQQQALRLHASGLVEQVGLKWLAGNFAAGQQLGGYGLHCRVAGGNFELRLLVFLFFVGRGLCMVKHHSDQGFGFEFSGRRERNCRFHSCYAGSR